MCDPITLTAIALTAASTGANYISSQTVAKARSDAYAAESLRQKKLDNEAAAINDQARDRYNDFEGDQNKRSGELADYYNTVQQQVVNPAGAPAETATGANAGSVVAQEFQKQGDKSNAFNQAQATAQGRVTGFGDILGDKMRLQGRDASTIGQIGKFKQGYASIFPLALEAANSEGQGWKLAGDILGGLGSVGLAYGLRAPIALAQGATKLGGAAAAGGVGAVQPALAATSAGPSLFSLY